MTNTNRCSGYNQLPSTADMPPPDVRRFLSTFNMDPMTRSNNSLYMAYKEDGQWLPYAFDSEDIPKAALVYVKKLLGDEFYITDEYLELHEARANYEDPILDGVPGVVTRSWKILNDHETVGFISIELVNLEKSTDDKPVYTNPNVGVSLNGSVRPTEKCIRAATLAGRAYALYKTVEQEEEEDAFYIIGTTPQGGFMLNEFELTKKSNVDRDEFLKSYNPEVEAFYDRMMKELNKETSSNCGIALLHGSPGTGKTSFIRHMIRKASKQVIYLPPDLACSMSDPRFITFLAQQCRKSVLLIEDAENILRTREAGGNQAMSNLLNASDGIMGDALSVQIVATFNADITEVDSALLRPGRLIGQMEFKPLNADRTRALVKKLYGDDIEPTNKSMTLAEIYSMNDTLIVTKKAEKAKFGFV